MTIYQLDEEQIDLFSKFPEVAMATQVATDDEGTAHVIASGRIAIKFDRRLGYDLNLRNEFFLGESFADKHMFAEKTESWSRSLPFAPRLRPVSRQEAWNALAFIHLGPRIPIPPVPYRPRYTHGHLPFQGTCGGIEKYYRYEQFPTSKRVDITTGRVVAKDTYGAPASEVPFTPTGLSAVGRFALPLLFPACWLYELTPPSGTRLFYGESVPLYGQSGGAVEIMLPDPFANVGPIPQPTVLPIL